MKRPVLALLFISLLVSVGCKTQPNEVEAYDDVSLGRFTVAVPADWQEVELPRDVADAVNDSEGIFIAVSYRDKSASADLALVVIDIKRSFEIEGSTWEGWDKLYEEQRFTRQEYAQMASDHFLFSLWVSQNESVQEIRMFTIGK